MRLGVIPDQSVLRTRILTGGSIHKVEHLLLENGEERVWKSGDWKAAQFFEAEATGLAALSEVQGVEVPKIFRRVADQEANISGLLLEYIPPGAQSAEAERALARQLVCLHQHAAEAYGFIEDNFIGTLSQENPWVDDWSEFFIHHRLGVQSSRAKELGWFQGAIEETFCAVVPFLEERLCQVQEPPVLLHGDLWSGNVVWGERGPVLIDPAVYFGSREADIAFMYFFGGFGRAFFDEYHKLLPLQEGFEERKEILNLYHLMTHANMFGGHYVQSFHRTLLGFG